MTIWGFEEILPSIGKFGFGRQGARKPSNAVILMGLRRPERNMEILNTEARRRGSEGSPASSPSLVVCTPHRNTALPLLAWGLGWNAREVRTAETAFLEEQ